MNTIQTAGVMRCCLATVGCDENGTEFEEAQNGDEDNCQHCNRLFRLTNGCWRPVPETELQEDNENMQVQIEDLLNQRELLKIKLQNAIARMDRARNILTDDNPTPTNNWGMLDTTDLK